MGPGVGPGKTRRFNPGPGTGDTHTRPAPVYENLPYYPYFP